MCFEVSRFLLPLAYLKSHVGNSFVYLVGRCPEVRADDISHFRSKC